MCSGPYTLVGIELPKCLFLKLIQGREAGMQHPTWIFAPQNFFLTWYELEQH